MGTPMERVSGQESRTRRAHPGGGGRSLDMRPQHRCPGSGAPRRSEQDKRGPAHITSRSWAWDQDTEDGTAFFLLQALLTDVQLKNQSRPL